MSKFLPGVFVVLAVLLAACGGGGDDDGTAGDDGQEAADDDRRSSGRSDRPPGDELATDASTGDEAGGDDTPADDTEVSADEQAYIDALTPAFEGTPVPPEETNCFVRAYVEVVGVERLRQMAPPEEIANNPMPTPADMGIELSPEDGERLYDILVTCMDVRTVFLTTLIGGGDPAFADCINNAVDDALLRRYVVALFVTDPESRDPDLETTFSNIYASCRPDATS